MKQPARQPRVLVIRGGAIGDFIVTLPAIRLLRENMANAHIEVLGYKSIAELAVAGGLADAVRNLEHAPMSRLFIPDAELDDAITGYFTSFNLVLSYLYDPDGILRGNMERMGVKTFLEASHAVVSGSGHATEQLARPLERLAMFLEDPAPRLSIVAEPSGAAPLIALHPGSGSLKKNWPVKNWARLGLALSSSRSAMKLALITGEAEAERGITAFLLEAWRGLEFLHWDQIPLPLLASRLAGCAGFVGHDSGISHLAAACGLPCLLLFGPTDPVTWAPRNEGVRVITAPDGDWGRLGLDSTGAEVKKFVDEIIARSL